MTVQTETAKAGDPRVVALVADAPGNIRILSRSFERSMRASRTVVHRAGSGRELAHRDA